MNRRSFLQFLGLAPIASTALASLPAPVESPTLLEIGDHVAELYGRSPMMDAVPSFRQWADEMNRAQSRLMLAADEPDRIPAALRA